MPIFKKLLFAPLFLIFFGLTAYQVNGVLNLNSIFSFDLKTFIPILYLVFSIILTSFFFAIFASLSQDTKIGVLVVLAAAVIPFIFLPLDLAIIFAIGSSLIFNSYFFQIVHKLKTYLTFSSQTLLFPSIKQISTLLIILISLTYYLSINKIIAEKGFEVPDSILDAALNFSGSTNPEIELRGDKYLAQLTQEQLDFLKQNPQLLESQGVDPELLNQVQVVPPASSQGKQGVQPPSQQIALPSANNVVKELLRDQLDKMLEPYKSWIAPFLSLMFFITLTSLSSLASIIFYPLLPLVFIILEKLKFIHFEKEMREVRKLVV